MAQGDFIWCDLSTFDVARAQGFYKAVLGWSYTTVQQPDGTDYHMARTGGSDAAAIFEMPGNFQKIGLPSFWMPYVQVDDAAAAVEQAARLGGKVELGPLPFSENGQIALIRDPLGAGFTVYDGTDLPPRQGAPRSGHPSWRALYVSDASAVIPFYETLFGWTIQPDTANTYGLKNGDTLIGGLEELRDEVRGKFQFWGIHFATPDLDHALSQAGSKAVVLTRFTRKGARTALLKDPDGAAFFLEETKRKPADIKWKTLVSLALIWIAVALDQNWVWGLLFLFWTMLAFKSRDTYLVERISRDETPMLYWAVMGSWVLLSLLLFFY